MQSESHVVFSIQSLVKRLFISKQIICLLLDTQRVDPNKLIKKRQPFFDRKDERR